MKRIESRLILFVSDEDFANESHPVHEALRYIQSGDNKKEILKDGYLDAKLTVEVADV